MNNIGYEFLDKLQFQCMTRHIDIVVLITIFEGIQKIRELFEKNFFKIYWFRPAGKNEYKYPSNS